jgi:hypothetical protein
MHAIQSAVPAPQVEIVEQCAPRRQILWDRSPLAGNASARLESCSPQLANESNTAMQQLLARVGYRWSGVIYNLDKNDPEFIFVSC